MSSLERCSQCLSQDAGKAAPADPPEAGSPRPRALARGPASHSLSSLQEETQKPRALHTEDGPTGTRERS